MVDKVTFDNLPQAVEEIAYELKRIKRLLEERENGKNKDADKPLSVKEAACFLDLKKSTIYSKVCKGELPYSKPGKQLYFDKKELIKYLQKNKRLTHQEIKNRAHTYL